MVNCGIFIKLKSKGQNVKMEIIKGQNLSFSYDKQVKVIDDLSFAIEKGEYVAIIGKNGSGKSTLAKLFNGLIKADSGTLSIFGITPIDKKSLYEVRKRVGVVFQNPDNQLVASIVEDDLAFGCENLGLPREEIKNRIDFALKMVDMEKYRYSTPERLSGGQKQRIAIAGILALKPDVLVLDESTAMLDPKGRESVLEVVKKLNREQGVTVITITHYMEEIVDCDRVLVLDKGKLVLSGTPKEIFANKEVIKGYGLELPLVSYIANRLSQKGVELGDDGILDKEELEKRLCK